MSEGTILGCIYGLSGAPLCWFHCTIGRSHWDTQCRDTLPCHRLVISRPLTRRSGPRGARSTDANVCAAGSLAVLYDHVFAARDERGFLSQPTLETCLQVPSLLPYLTDVPFFCGVIFDQGPVSNYSAETLVDFCSYFVDPARISSRKEQRRWLACVHGSVMNFLGVADVHSLELKTAVGYCRQLFHVEWQPAAFREQAYELCASIWAVNFREYTWEVDTKLWSYMLEL